MQAGIGHDGGFAASPSANGMRFAGGAGTGPDDHGDFPWEACDASSLTLWRPAPGAVVVLPAYLTLTYDYPLLVSLADCEDRHQECPEWLAAVSERNYVALSLEPRLLGTAPAWTGQSALTLGMQRYRSLLRVVDGVVPIHSTRRYVVGYGDGWERAVQWFLLRPEWFSGVIVVEPRSCEPVALRCNAASVQGRPLLWLSQPKSPTSMEGAALIALQALGLNLQAETASEAPEIADRINRWLMSQIPTAIV
ncbi:MAG: hypothetical protein R3B90_02070 [Planctomycetaceae bacterium]